MSYSSSVRRGSLRNRNRLRWVLLSCAIGATSYYCQPTYGQTWNAPGTGSWHDGANWSGGTVPDSASANAVIDAVHPVVVPPDEPLPPYTITLDADTTVDSLLLNSLDANLNHSAGVLTVGSLFDINQGSYLLNGGAISGGQLRNNGNLFVQSDSVLSNVEVLDDLVLRSTDFGRQLSLNNDTVLGKGIVFKNSVILSLQQDLSLTFGNKITTDTFVYGRIEVNDGNTLTIDDGASIDSRRLEIYGLGNLINNGLISSSGPTTLSISIANDSVTNNGTIQAGDRAIVKISSADFHNTITGKVIATDGGRVVIGDQNGSNSWSSEGLIQVADSTSTIELAGQFTNADFATVENKNGGRIEISGIWNNQDGHTFTADQGYVELNGATVVGGHLTAGANGEFVHVTDAKFDGVQFNGDLNIDGQDHSASLYNDSKVSGNINVSGGANIYFDQDYTVESGRELNLSGADSTSYLYLGDGRTLTVAEGAKIQASESEIEGFDYDTGATLVNQGTIDFKGNNYAQYFDFQNKGSVTLSESTSSFQHLLGSFDNQSTGNIQVADGAYLDIETLVNTGTIKLQGQDSQFWIGNVSSSSLNGIDNQAGGMIAVTQTWDNQQGYTFNSTTGSIHLYGEIIGGSLTPGSNGEFIIVHDGYLNGVAVNGDLSYGNGSSLTLSGNTQINGNITVGSSLYLEQDFNIADGQTIRLTGGDSQIYVYEPFALSFAAGSILAGNGTIITSNGTVEISGTVSPGFSPGHIEFQSDVILGSTSKLEIELASLSSFDTLDIKGNAVLGGDLNVSLLNGFALASNQSFLFMNIDGSASGMFNGLMENGIVGNYGGVDLFISYVGGDGNDVRLFTAIAVPEPASVGLLAACGVAFVGWRRRKQVLKVGG